MRDAERLDLPSASSFGMDCLCPGRRQMLATLPDGYVEPEDEVATRGALLHRAWELGNASELTEEEDIEIFETGNRNGQQLLAQWRQDFGLENVREGPREERFFLNDPATMRPIASARLDIHWIGESQSTLTHHGGTHVLVDERKSLWCSNLPPSEKAWQGRLQVVLASNEYDAQHVRFAFNKPMLRSTDVCDYMPGDIAHAGAAILYHVWETKQPGAQRIAGSHCRFCPCKPFCPEAASWSLLPSVIARAASPSPADIEQAVNALVPADLVRVWQASAIVGKIQDAVKARLKGFSDEDLVALGIERGKARVTRSIDAVEAAFRYMKDTVNVPESALFDALKFSNAELAKVLRREVGMSAEGAPAWIKETLANFITESESEAPLVLLK